MSREKKMKRLYVLFTIFFWFRQWIEQKHACLFINSSIRGFVIVAILIAVHELSKMNGRDIEEEICLWIQSNEIISLVYISNSNNFGSFALSLSLFLCDANHTFAII